MLSSLPILLSLSAAVVVPAQAALVEHYWNISYAPANPDRMFERRAIGVNGSWPPPPVEVTRGDTLRIHAYNGLGDVSTALHTHGNFFNGSGENDGAVGVTQCPIPPGDTFIYEIPTELQEGTYWIHGHYSGQYTDGLRTPFIIHPANNTGRRDNTTWDEEFTVTLGDWYHEEHPVLIKEFMSIYNPTGAEPVPPSSIMYLSQNGQYLGKETDVAQGINVGDQMTIPFEAGKTYKLRFINMAALAMFNVYIDGHEMQIIEADGVEVEPYSVSHFPISVAQRYSVLVKARSDGSSNWPIHANMDPQMFDQVPDDLQLNLTATISYSPNNTREEGTLLDADAYDFFDDAKMVPLAAVAMAPADVSLQMVFAFDTYDNGVNRAGFNDITYQSPLVPTIFTQLSMGENSSLPAVYGSQTNTFVLKHMDMVELVINNTDSGQHPFHFHGHNFQIVHRSMDVTSDDPEINPPLIEGQINPFKRDVVMVPPGGSTSIRFRADNPGSWIFHCHIDWHLSSGLAAIFVTGVPEAQKTLTIPQFMHDQCAKANIPSSGNVVGTFSTTDFAGETLGPFPIVAGWTAKARGALAGCILSALCGMIAVVWYSWGALDDSEIEEEEQRRHEQKLRDQAAGKKSGVLGLFNKVTGRQ